MVNQSQETAGRTASSISISGIIFAALAAIGYTAANFFMRSLAETTPSELVVTIKAAFTALVFVPWLMGLIWVERAEKNTAGAKPEKVIGQGALRGTKQNVIPPLRVCLLLVFASVIVQFGGNLTFQWSLELIGIALSVPLLMSVMIISGAILGWAFLREPVATNMWIAIGLFVASIFILSQGVHATSEVADVLETDVIETDVIENVESSQIGIGGKILGILAACASGFAYAILGMAVRTSMNFGTPSATPMAFVGLIGGVGLGAMTIMNHGVEIFAQTNCDTWQFLLGAAACNTLAFLFLTQAFKHLPIVYVNATNVTQIAMAAMIGVWYFHEPFSGYLVVGILLMTAGFVVLGFKSRGKQTVAREVTQPAK